MVAYTVVTRGAPFTFWHVTPVQFEVQGFPAAHPDRSGGLPKAILML